jgi:tryptophan synthase beta chain
MALREVQGPYFGPYGGRFVPESLVAALDELESTYRQAQADSNFLVELAELHKNYTGRPSILTEAKRFSTHAGGAGIILKREDLNHTGSHKINNVLGQALLAKRMGKTRIIAETDVFAGESPRPNYPSRRTASANPGGKFLARE